MSITRMLLSSFVLLAAACARPAAVSGDPEYAIAPDRAADSLLVDVQDLDSTIQVEMRYHTANNFTSGPSAPGRLTSWTTATSPGGAATTWAWRST